MMRCILLFAALFLTCSATSEAATTACRRTASLSRSFERASTKCNDAQQSLKAKAEQLQSLLDLPVPLSLKEQRLHELQVRVLRRRVAILEKRAFNTCRRATQFEQKLITYRSECGASSLALSQGVAPTTPCVDQLTQRQAQCRVLAPLVDDSCQSSYTLLSSVVGEVGVCAQGSTPAVGEQFNAAYSYFYDSQTKMQRHLQGSGANVKILYSGKAYTKPGRYETILLVTHSTRIQEPSIFSQPTFQSTNECTRFIREAEQCRAAIAAVRPNDYWTVDPATSFSNSPGSPGTLFVADMWTAQLNTQQVVYCSYSDQAAATNCGMTASGAFCLPGQTAGLCYPAR